MKPLSEKVEEMLKAQDFFEAAYVYRHAPLLPQDVVVNRFEELKGHIREELQAWLREADAWTKKWKMVGKFDYESRLVFKGFRKVVRTELLGTTREGVKK